MNNWNRFLAYKICLLFPLKAHRQMVDLVLLWKNNKITLLNKFWCQLLHYEIDPRKSETLLYFQSSSCNREKFSALFSSYKQWLTPSTIIKYFPQSLRSAVSHNPTTIDSSLHINTLSIWPTYVRTTDWRRNHNSNSSSTWETRSEIKYETLGMRNERKLTPWARRQVHTVNWNSQLELQ